MSKQLVSNSPILASQKGMSLIEILIAITLLGIVGTFVATNVLTSLEEGKYDSAKIQIQNLGGALKDFKRRCGIYPTTEQGLEALVEAPTSGRECKRYRPIIDKLPLDPWDTPFQYESDGKTYVIRSLGADGFEGGEDFDKDISSEDV
ncbi:MAG: type II secretion system major pseudopilin GspG [Bdellovibrionota bacterium]|nr:type II secretion system major pseudopilin GspG [Bdellovibrionota bacterium]